MGRHARGAARSRITASTVVLGTLIVGVIAVGSWLSSRAQPTPIAATEVSGTAMVISSLSCTDGTGGTLVDVLTPAGPPVRTSLDACGHQEGELLAVRYPAADPGSAWIASQDPQVDATGADLLPIGLAIAALLVLSAVLALWLDSRRVRRARAAGPVAHTHERLDDVVSVPEELPEALSRDRTDAVTPVITRSPGRHALPEPSPELIEPLDSRSEVRRLSSVDLTFPSTAGLAASLHDELFTHRGVTT